MNIWVCIDDRERIIAINTNDMSGNNGWVMTTDADLTRDIDVGVETFIARMTTSDGVPRFVFVSGSASERSQEDIDTDTLGTAQTNTDPVAELEGRVSTVETTTDEITLLLADVIGGAI